MWAVSVEVPAVLMSFPSCAEERMYMHPFPALTPEIASQQIFKKKAGEQ